MPVDLPRHNDPIPYDKGKWVPAGWKPLNTSAKTRHLIMAMIAKKKLEAHDKESQINAQKKKKEERREAKLRAKDELDKIEAEMQECLQKREELAKLKHDQFGRLKVVIGRQSQLKKIEEDRKRNEEAINQLLNPQQYANAINKPAVQSNSLISQQFLSTPQIPQYQPPTSAHYNNMLQQQLVQSLTQQHPALSKAHQTQQLLQAVNLAALNKPILQPQTSHTPQIRNQLIAPPAQSPFYPGSHYASPAPSRSASFTVPHQDMNSPRRDRPMMASPGTKYATQQGRHNTFSGGTRPITSVDQLRPSHTGTHSPVIPVSNQLQIPGMSGLQPPPLQHMASRSNLLQQLQLQQFQQQQQQQHQATPPPQGIRR